MRRGVSGMRRAGRGIAVALLVTVGAACRSSNSVTPPDLSKYSATLRVDSSVYHLANGTAWFLRIQVRLQNTGSADIWTPRLNPCASSSSLPPLDLIRTDTVTTRLRWCDSTLTRVPAQISFSLAPGASQTYTYYMMSPAPPPDARPVTGTMVARMEVYASALLQAETLLPVAMRTSAPFTVVAPP